MRAPELPQTSTDSTVSFQNFSNMDVLASLHIAPAHDAVENTDALASDRALLDDFKEVGVGNSLEGSRPLGCIC